MCLRLGLGLCLVATVLSVAGCVSGLGFTKHAQSAMPPPELMRDERGGIPLPYGPRRVADAMTPAPMYTPQHLYAPPPAPTASPTISTAPSPDTSFRPQPEPGPTFRPTPPPVVAPAPRP